MKKLYWAAGLLLVSTAGFAEGLPVEQQAWADFYAEEGGNARVSAYLSECGKEAMGHAIGGNVYMLNKSMAHSKRYLPEADSNPLAWSIFLQISAYQMGYQEMIGTLFSVNGGDFKADTCQEFVNLASDML